MPDVFIEELIFLNLLTPLYFINRHNSNVFIKNNVNF